jgi:FixJ family two-component response regulator
MEKRKITVLLVDDDEDYFVLVKGLLRDITDVEFTTEWAETYERGLELVLAGKHDVYLVDFRLGARSGLELVKEAVAKGCRLPLVLLTGQGDRILDLEAVSLGAADYLDKNGISAVLLERSIRYAVERARLVRELQDALDQIKTLNGLLPICASCKKIRDDSGYWNQLESYVEKHSGAQFSHSICPECMQKLYPAYYTPEAGPLPQEPGPGTGDKKGPDKSREKI